MFVLVAMLAQNGLSVYAAATSPEPIQVENEFIDEQSDEPSIEVVTEETSDDENYEEGGTEVEYVDGDVDDSGEEPSSDENYDDEIMLISEDEEVVEEVADEAEEEEEAEEEQVPEEIEILDTQISGSGLDELEIYVDTEDLNEKDSFRIIFTGPDDASYDSLINEKLSKSAGGYYTFANLNKEGFNIRVSTNDDITVTFTKDGRTPVIKLESNSEDEEKLLETKSLTSKDGSPISAIYGKGYKEISVDLTTENFTDNTKYTLFVETSADATVDGKSAKDGIKGLDAETENVEIKGLDGEEFTVYATAEKKDTVLYTQAKVEDEEDGKASILIREEEEVRTKRVYKYSDSNVTVTATLEDPQAVPDDAEFVVTPITVQNAVDAYIDALNDADSEIEYTEDNTLLYDVAFIVEEEDEDGNVKKVEFEPELGSVTIDIRFNKSQLTDEIGATSDENVVVNHLPLKEAAKENVDTTVEATDISASDVIVEPVKADITVTENGADKVELTLDSLSVLAITSDNGAYVLKVSDSKVLTTSKDRSRLSILGKGENYGLIANTMKNTDDLETNFLVDKIYNINANFGTSSSYSNTGAHVYIGGIYADDQFRTLLTGDKSYNTKQYCPVTIKDNNNLNVTFGGSGAYMVDASAYGITSAGAVVSDIASKFSAYSNLSDDEGKKPCFLEKVNVNGKQGYSVDISNLGAGTYVIDYDKISWYWDGTAQQNREGASINWDGDALNIKLNEATQDVIININVPEGQREFNFRLPYINGVGCNTLHGAGEAYDDMLNSVAYNFGDFSGRINMETVGGMTIAPNADVYYNSCSGVLVCNNIVGCSGEWHYHNHGLPPVEEPNVRAGDFEFKLKKSFFGYPDNNPSTINSKTVTKLNEWPVETSVQFEIKQIMPGESERGVNWLVGDRRFIEGTQTVTLSKGDAPASIVKAVVPYSDRTTYKVTEGDQWCGYIKDAVYKYAYQTYFFKVTEKFEKCTNANCTDVNCTKAHKINGVKYKDIQSYHYLDDNGNVVEKPNSETTREFDLYQDKNGVVYVDAVRYLKLNVNYYGNTADETKASHKWVNIEPSWSNTNGTDHAANNGENTGCLGYPIDVEFMNSFKPIENALPTKVQLGVNKKLAGEYNPDDAKNFEFKLYKTGAALRKDATDGTVSEKGTITFSSADFGSTAAATKLFSEVELGKNDIDAENKAYFVIQETQADGWSAQNPWAHIIVELDTKIENRVLKYYVKSIEWFYDFTDSGRTTHKEPKFVYGSGNAVIPATNTKKVAKGTVSGAKLINGAVATMTPGEYTFTVTNNNTTGVKSFPATLTNDASGNIKPENDAKFVFTKAGTYTFSVSEVDPRKAGMTRDTRTYTLTFNVSADDIQNSEQALEPTVTGGDTTGVNAGKLVFDNTYNKDGTNKFTINKTVSGSDVPDTTASFSVFASDANGTKGAALTGYASKSVSVKAGSGSVEVQLPTYQLSDCGDKYYLVEEDNSGSDNVLSTGTLVNNPSYTQYLVKVAISDVAGQQKLSVVPTYQMRTGTKGENGTVTYGSWGTASAVSFTNKFVKPASLPVSVIKSITLPTGVNKTFEFTLQETESNYTTAKAGFSPVTLTWNTALTTQTANSTTISYTKADVGMHYYTITETVPTGAVNNKLNGITYDPTPKKFSVYVKYDDATGAVSVVESQTSSTAVTSVEKTVENTYDSTPTKFTINGVKGYVGSFPADKKTFSFALFAADGTTAIKQPGTNNDWVVQNSTDGTFKFVDIPLDTVGEHTFVVKEISSNDSNIIDDPNKTRTVKVTVFDTGNGTLDTKDITYVDGGNAVSFSNTYVTPGEANIRALKKFFYKGTTVNSGRPLSGFKFQLLDGTNVIREAISGADGSVVFTPALSYTLADLGEDGTATKIYTVHEVVEKAAGVDYATNGNDKTVTVTLKRNGNGIDTAVTYPTEAGFATECTSQAIIVNEITVTGTSTEIGGTKTMVGRDLADDDNFQVGLYSDSACTKLVGTDTITKSGTFGFRLPINQTEEFGYADLGEKTYYLKEIVPTTDKLESVIYSDAVYSVTFEVKINPNDTSKLMCTAPVYALVGGTGSTGTANFTNRYVEPGEVGFSAKKFLSGKAISNEQFTFKLYDGTGTKLDEVKNNGNNVDFEYKASFDANDLGKTYTYKIEEVVPASASASGLGYKYGSDADNTLFYTAEVSIADELDANGNIVITGPVYKAKGTTVKSEAVFNNEYKAEGFMTLSGEKYMNDEKYTGADVDQFTFTVYNEDGTIAKDKNGANLVAHNDADGNITFAEMKFTQDDLVEAGKKDGVYYKYYYIRESAKAPYEHDQKIVNVVVTLRDDNEGHITATYKTAKDNDSLVKDDHWWNKLWNFVTGTNVSEIKFENKYNAEGSVQFSVTKAFDAALSDIEKNYLKTKSYTFKLMEGDTQIGEPVVIAGSDVGTSAGTKDFDVINYAMPKADGKYEVGRHVYTITEEKVDGNGVKYDEAIYTATVVVSDRDANGNRLAKLSVNTTITKSTDSAFSATMSSNTSGACENAPVVFTNGINPSNTNIPVLGTKNLVNFENITNTEEFVFTLAKADGGSFKVKTTNGYNTVTSVTQRTHEGNFAFDNLYFDNSDLVGSPMTFKVTEVDPTTANVSKEPKDGYTFVVTLSLDDSGSVKAAVTDAQGTAIDPADHRYAFTNTYNNDGTFSIVGNKSMNTSKKALGTYSFYLIEAELKDGTVVAKTANPSAGFTSTEIVRGTETKTVYAKTTTNGSNGTISFADVVQLAPSDITKDRYYIVEEKLEENDENVKYDEAVYYVKVPIALDSTTGKISGTPEYYTDNACTQTAPNGLSFVNTYTANGFAEIEGNKLLMMGSDQQVKAFAKGAYKVQFMTSLQDTNPVTIEIDASDENGLGAFKFTGDDSEGATGIFVEALKYDLDDVDGNPHTYYIKEFIPEGATSENGYTLDGVKYDPTIYEVNITVTDSNQNGVLNVGEPVISIYNENATSGKTSLLDAIKALFAGKPEIKFVNEYIADTSWDPAGFKKLTGRDDLGENEFRFQIEELSFTDHTGKVTTKFNPERKYDQVRNDADGHFTFDSSKIDFLRYDIDDVGTHVYKISEVDEGKEGIEYSKIEYTVTVVVSFDEKTRQLSANVTDESYANNSAAEAELFTQNAHTYSFINVCEAKAALDLKGTKLMTGRTLGEFEHYDFSITRLDADGNPDESTKKIVTSTGANIEFLHTAIPALNFDQNDAGKDIKFLIKEEPNKNDNNVEIDTNNYRVTVHVDYFKNADGTPIHNGTLKLTVKSGIVDSNGNAVEYDRVVGSTLENKIPVYTSQNTVVFTNTYEATGEITLAGKKHVKINGNEVTAPSEDLKGYSFMIFEYDSEADRARNDNSNRRQIGAAEYSDANGNYLFHMAYDQDDLKINGKTVDEKTHYYKIFEYNPVNKGYHIGNDATITVGETTYALKEYDVDVLVKSTGTKLLDVTATCANGTITRSGNAGAYTFSGFDYVNEVTRTTKLTVNKIWRDGLGTAKRPDVVIRLYANGTEVDRVTLTYPDKQSHTFTNLPVADENGKTIEYTVEEDPIPGYTSDKSRTENESGIEYDIYNTSGKVRIRKISAETGETLAGAVLAIIDAAGNEVERWTSEVAAHSVEAKLTPGAKYRLREITAPEGYMVAGDVEFTAPEEGEITVTMEDERIRGRVRLTKLDAANREALSGATFALYREDGTRVYGSGTAGLYRYSETSSNAVFAVGSTGVLEVSNLPYGTYYFTELSAPYGYALSSERVSFSVLTNDSLAEVTFLNTKVLGSARLRKIASDSGRPLAGAVFELYARTPSSLTSAIASTLYRDAYYRVGTYTTDADGMIYVGDLPWDDYYFVEIQAPEGYELSRDVNGELLVYRFTVGEGGTADLTYDLGSITNSPTPETPPTPPTTPRRGGEVRGERRREDAGRRSGGVLSGVLGVRAAPKAGVLGERLGPVTGDAANIFLWTLLLLASLGSIFGVLIANIRRKKKTA